MPHNTTLFRDLAGRLTNDGCTKAAAGAVLDIIGPDPISAYDRSIGYIEMLVRVWPLACRVQDQLPGHLSDVMPGVAEFLIRRLPAVFAANDAEWSLHRFGNPVTLALSIADKLDSIVALWAAGCAPTGSKDAYALRRAAIALWKDLRAARWMEIFGYG